MFRVARLLRGVSPFSIFLMDQKNNPSLQGVSIGKRGKMLSKMYKSLSQRQHRDLQKRAKAHPSLRKAAKRRRPSRPTEFSEFVRKNFKVVQGLNYSKRFAALSQLYELNKPLDVQVSKAVKELAAKKQQRAAQRRLQPAQKTLKAAAAKRKQTGAQKKASSKK